MKVRCVPFALVSAAWFAASVAIPSDAFASPEANIATVSKAFQALKKGDAAEAIPLFSQAIESRELPVENLANALLNRASAHQMRNDHKSAIEDYTAALNLDAMGANLRATALHNRGLSHQKLGQRAKAIEDYTNALFLNPKFAHAFHARGMLLKDAGQLLFAVSDFERALRFEHPDPARVHFALGETFLKLKRHNDARREFSMTLKLHPDHAKAKAHLDSLGTAKLEPEAEADPILTGSTTPVAGSTDALKAELPKAIEPPAELLLDGTRIASAKPAKVYVDRLPASEEMELAASVEAAQADTISEPSASPPATAIEMAEAGKPVHVKRVEADPIQTAGIAPAGEGAAAATKTAAWSVQISSAVSEDAAWSTWKKLRAKHGLSDEFQPIVQRADLGTKGIFFRLRLNFNEKGDAQSACKQLAAKKMACFVSKG